MEVNATISDTDAAKQHYDSLYAKGYMDGIDEQTVRILRNVFTAANLPEKGIALDYGCGSGAYTGLLQEMLPGWEIQGVDISQTSLEIGRERLPGISFSSLESLEAKSGYFDLVFSHHVLEHVQDIDETFHIFSRICKAHAVLIHALPCGNPGSLEHTICQMRDDGIDPLHGNRFFYEDPTHLRRLTTEQMNSLAGGIGFSLTHEWYSNHYYTALDWLARSVRELRAELFDPGKTKSMGYKATLIKYRTITEILAIAKKVSTKGKSPAGSFRGKILKRIFRLTLCPVADMLTSWFDNEAEKERQDGGKRNGSAMFLAYSR